MDEASLAQFRAATAPSRRVAHLRHVRDCVIKRDADPYLRPAEVLALLEPERLGAVAAAASALVQRGDVLCCAAECRVNGRE